MKLEFDPRHDISYRYFRCPECGNRFFWGGPAQHGAGCNIPGFDGCVVIIGPKVVENIKEWAREHGNESQEPLSEISLKDIQEQLPEILQK